MGNLVFQATLGGQVNLVGPNTASTFNINVPTVNGNMVTTGDTGTVTNTMLAGSIANAKLTNSSVTIGGTSIALGASSSAITNDITISGLTVGKGAGAQSTNTAVGYQAINSGSNSGTGLAAFGYQALAANTSGTGSAFGYVALAQNTTGGSNSAFGQLALYANTTGSYNVGVGAQALISNTTASNNTAVGYQAGYSQTTATDSAFFGYQAGNGVTTGSFNTYIGSRSGISATTGTRNTFLGRDSGADVSTADRCTILGRFSGNQGGLDIRTASNYIVLSDGDGNPAAYRASTGAWTFGLGGTTAASYEGALVLNGAATTGRGAAINGQSNGSNSWSIGDYGYVVSGTSRFFAVANSGGGGVYLNGASATSWTAVSDETRKIIIEPITDAANKVATLRTVIGRLKSDDESVRRPYLIAQDVQAVLPEAVSAAEDKNGPLLGLSYTEVIPLLVAAIKELKTEIDVLKARV